MAHLHDSSPCILIQRGAPDAHQCVILVLDGKTPTRWGQCIYKRGVKQRYGHEIRLRDSCIPTYGCVVLDGAVSVVAVFSCWVASSAAVPAEAGVGGAGQITLRPLAL